MGDHVAIATIEIDASPGDVWTALTEPEQIEKYMFGSQVVTDWQPGSPIVWKGEYEGKKYEDKGEIVEIEQARRLKVTHFSPMSGEEDIPANYHTVLTSSRTMDGKRASHSAKTTTRARRRPSTRKPIGRRCSPA